MIATAFSDLWYGFGVAFEPHNLMWCFIGVFAGNMVGGVAFGIVAIFSAYKLIDAIGETFKPPENPAVHEVV